MPILASLTRSLTLPLNRKHRARSNTVTNPNDDPPTLSSEPEPIQFSISQPAPPSRPQPRRYNSSFLGKSSPNSTGIFNRGPLDGLSRSNTTKSVKQSAGESAFVPPPYLGPDNATPQGVVFGKPLKESLEYASVQISTANSNGELYTWGYIPVVVAKCGLYLKENATEVPGTFRINGSARRMRILQEAFETPPRYGKNLDWKQEDFTTHDVASVFRRYLTQMPEPVIPHDLYHQFRDTLAREPFNQEEVIARYKSLIRQMPRANQYLLLYVLDLLNVFSRKSDINLMNATNLAVIFRPGLISHPNHEMSPKEHALSQKVLEFLIAQQDWFMLEIPPPPPRRGSQQRTVTSPLSPSDPRFHDRRGTEQYPSSSAPNTSTLSSHKHNVSSSGNSNGFRNPSGSSSSAAYPSGGQTSPSSPSPPTRQHRISRFGSSSGRRPLSGMGSDVDDVMIIPGGVLEEREEFSAGAGGGWRLVTKTAKEKEKERLKMLRRRTTMERSDVVTDTEDTEHPSPTITNNDGVTVKRSSTLPSSRRRHGQSHNSSGDLVVSSSTGTGKENLASGGGPKRGMLLKKNRRISSNVIEKERTS